MATIASIRKHLDAAAADVAELSAANDASAADQQGERDKALQAAADAGLSVNTDQLPPIGASEAQARFLTLGSLIIDASAQLDQIGSLTG